MEDKIRSIISNIGMQIYETTEVFTVDHASRKIARYMIEFIDWLTKEVTLKLVWHDNIGYTKEWHYLPDKWNKRGTTGKCWSLDELFEHWYDNIREDAA